MSLIIICRINSYSTFLDTQGLNFSDYALTHFDLGKKAKKHKPGSSKLKSKAKKLCTACKVNTIISIDYFQIFTLVLLNYVRICI